jgi:hypothetical protein
MHFSKTPKIECILFSVRAPLFPWLKGACMTRFPEVRLRYRVDTVQQAIIQILSGKKPEMLILDNWEKLPSEDMHSLKTEAEAAGVVIAELPKMGIQALETSKNKMQSRSTPKNLWRAEICKGLSEVYEKRSGIIIGSGKSGVVSFENIMYIRAEGAYARFVLKDGTAFLTTRNLGFFDCRLPKSRFIRIHNAFFININFVKMLKTNKPFMVVLKAENILLPVAQRRMKILKSLFKSRGLPVASS